MNIAEYAIKKRTVTLIFTLFIIVAGLFSYEHLGRLEDPEFTIKEAQIITYYPGATAKQVAEEVSDKLETQIQSLGEVKKIKSINKRGVSIITVTMKDQYGANDLPLIWQKLRSKVSDITPQLPPGTSVPIVNDDYGDVFGVLFAITGDGYSYAELKNYAKYLRKELLLVQILNNKNTILPAGQVKVGVNYLTIHTQGNINAIEDIKNLVIHSSKQTNTKKLIYLKDIAHIYKGYVDPPQKLIEFNNHPAITLGISTVKGGNVVVMGQAIEAKIAELKQNIPIGLELNVISLQSERVTASINAFIINLLEAVIIVIAVLMIFMGLRSALIIGTALFVTVMATFVLMKMQGILLERISLGALIIALGMLVDNAIVVIDGMLVRISKGIDRFKAASEVVGQNFWPLLGATTIAILAFGAIGLSQDSTGEYTRSLFYVILYSLLLSWLVAITVVPLLGVIFIKVKENKEQKDPYAGRFYQGLKKLLVILISRKWITVIVMLGLLYSAFLTFGQLKNSFFPSASRNQFMTNLYFPAGTDVHQVKKIADEFGKYMEKNSKIKSVSTFINSGAPRFLLTYTPESDSNAYVFYVVFITIF